MAKTRIFALFSVLILTLALFNVSAQPQVSVEFYFPHYYNPTFKAQTNEQVIISKGYRGRGYFWGSVYITNTGAEPVENLVLEVYAPEEEGFKILTPPKGGEVGEDSKMFSYTISKLDPGKRIYASFKCAVPETLTSKIVTFKVVVKTADGTVIYESEEKRPFIPPPFMIYAATFIVSIVVILIAFYLISKGKLYGKSFKTKDLIYTTIFGVLLVIWVQIIGRSLGFFAMTNKIPIPFVNYALGDVGYATIFVLGVLLIRKPGVATLMHIVYQFVSQLFWYGLDARWMLYSIVEGVPVDLYLAFVNRMLALKAGGEVTAIRPTGIFGYIDAAITGALRALFAWISLYYVFFPYLNHYYTTTYVVFMHTTTITVFNAIYGAVLAYPLFRILEKLVP